MTVRIGLMGFGHVGRTIFRLLDGRRDVEVVAVSDIADPQSLVYLLKYDSTYGRFPAPVGWRDPCLVVRERDIALMQGANPGDVAWQKYGVDVVIEATGRSQPRASLAKHLEQGAKRVVLCAPAADAPDATVIMGHNEHLLTPAHRIVANGSMTVHAATPVVATLDQAFGVERLFMTVINAYTQDQRLADMPGLDLRRSRAASCNIVPTASTSAALLGEVIPSLRGKVTAMALKVPVANGSVVDLVSFTRKPLSAAAVNDAMRAAAAGPKRGVLEVVDDPIVSSDVRQNPASSVFDAQATMALGGHAVKTLAWFDNGWGYASRAIALAERLAQLEGAPA